MNKCTVRKVSSQYLFPQWFSSVLYSSVFTDVWQGRFISELKLSLEIIHIFINMTSALKSLLIPLPNNKRERLSDDTWSKLVDSNCEMNRQFTEHKINSKQRHCTGIPSKNSWLFWRIVRFIYLHYTSGQPDILVWPAFTQCFIQLCTVPFPGGMCFQTWGYV